METVHLLGAEKTLFGVLTSPEAGKGLGRTAAILLNSGLQHRVGPFRLYVELARKLADQGVAVLRIDLSGRGDSERRKRLGLLDSIEADFGEAADFLQSHQQIEKLILIGLCSGADDALYLASKYPTIAGVVLLDGYAARTFKYYANHYGPRLLRLRSWSGLFARCLKRGLAIANGKGASGESGEAIDFMALQAPVGRREMRQRFESSFGHGCKFLCIFTSGVEDYYNHGGQLENWLGRRVVGDHLTEIFIEGAAHTYPLMIHRRKLFERISTWIKYEFSDGRMNGSILTPQHSEAR